MMAIRDILEDACKTPRKYISIYGLLHVDNERVYGYVDKLGSSLVLVRQFHDFLHHGWRVAQISDIAKVSHGNGYDDTVIRSEGRFSEQQPIPNVDISCMEAAIRDIDRLYGQIAIYDKVGRDTGAFLLGRVLGLVGDDVRLLPYSSDGYWDEEEYSVSLHDIVMIECETPYMRAMYKYLRTHEERSGDT
jgi:hypothetical protein